MCGADKQLCAALDSLRRSLENKNLCVSFVAIDAPKGGLHLLKWFAQVGWLEGGASSLTCLASFRVWSTPQILFTPEEGQKGLFPSSLACRGAILG